MTKEKSAEKREGRSDLGNQKKRKRSSMANKGTEDHETEVDNMDLDMNDQTPSPSPRHKKSPVVEARNNFQPFKPKAVSPPPGADEEQSPPQEEEPITVEAYSKVDFVALWPSVSKTLNGNRQELITLVQGCEFPVFVAGLGHWRTEKAKSHHAQAAQWI